MKYSLPLKHNGTNFGRVGVETDGMWARIDAEAAESSALTRLWLCTEFGRVRLGVMEPEGGTLRLRRRIALKELPKNIENGWGELDVGWERVRGDAVEVEDAILARNIHRAEELWIRRNGDGFELAAEYAGRNGFALIPAFTVSRTVRIDGRDCGAITFDRRGRIVRG